MEMKPPAERPAALVPRSTADNETETSGLIGHGGGDNSSSQLAHAGGGGGGCTPGTQRCLIVVLVIAVAIEAVLILMLGDTNQTYRATCAALPAVPYDPAVAERLLLLSDVRAAPRLLLCRTHHAPAGVFLCAQRSPLPGRTARTIPDRLRVRTAVGRRRCTAGQPS